jgi:hypothetical protein
MNPWDAFRSHDPSVRASDADRERIAERLRTHHTDGRLDTTELQQRIDACYSAKTLGELDQLLHDLPREPDPDEHRRRYGIPIWAMPRLVPLVAVLIVVSAITGAHLIWLAIPLFFAIRFGLLGRRYGRYGACSISRRTV